MTHEEIRKAWLVGTTCSCRTKDVREVLFGSATHIVLCHRAHPEYCGRWIGIRNCGSYARLYEIKVLLAALKSRNYGGMSAPHLLEWRGRMSKKGIKQDCLNLGVEFHG